jgi:hypothetical protein
MGEGRHVIEADVKVSEQMRMKAAAENLVRMVRLGLVWMADGGWALA